jgi:hypothetical protein
METESGTPVAFTERRAPELGVRRYRATAAEVAGLVLVADSGKTTEAGAIGVGAGRCRFRRND